MDRNAFDWIFSTAPQAIAAFVGLIYAGVSFIYSKIDIVIEKDPTLKEIYDSIKTYMYSGLKILLKWTFISILLDLCMIFVNPSMSDYKNRVYLILPILILLFNFYVIFRAFKYVSKIMDPECVNSTANKLIQEYLPSKNQETVNVNIFISDYRSLEEIIEKIKHELNYLTDNRKTISELVNMLLNSNFITKEESVLLFEIIRLRNLVYHGEINLIDKNIDIRLREIVQVLKRKLDERISAFEYYY